MKSEVQFIINRTCRVCGSDTFKRVLSLGNQKIVDFPLTPESDKPITPLELNLCTHCYLVQLGHTVNPDLLFREFWYRSSINEMMKAALLDVVLKGYEKANLKPGDVVCDIGANDGSMLEMFPKEILTVGFDPSNQITTPEAKNRMTYAIHNYFNREDAWNIITKERKKFKLITIIAMFYDLSDPSEFLNEVKSVLDDNGVIVIQMNYLLSMLQNNAFDNISAEHVTYYSLTSLRWLLLRCGLDVIDVETNDTNGGSFRVYLKKVPISSKDLSHFDRVREMLDKEKVSGLTRVDTYINFGKRIKENLQLLLDYVTKVTLEGNVVYAYGASTRGTTLLQSTPMPLPLAGVAERDENKFGRYMVANTLKIYNEDYVRSRCRYMLVLPWHFIDGIRVRELEWISNGGTLIVPLPEPYVITKDSESTLKELMVSQNT